jgi:hypothetical protein
MNIHYSIRGWGFIKKSLIGEIRLNNKKYKAMKTKTILIRI